MKMLECVAGKHSFERWFYCSLINPNSITPSQFLNSASIEKILWLQRYPILFCMIPDLKILESCHSFDIVRHCIDNDIYNLCNYVVWDKSDEARQIKYVRYLVEHTSLYTTVFDFMETDTIHGYISPKLKLMSI